MKDKFLHWLLQKGGLKILLIALAIIAVLFLIFVVGLLLGLSVLGAFLLIVLVGSILVAIGITRLVMTKKQGDNLIKSMMDNTEGNDRLALKNKITEAIQKIKHSELGVGYSGQSALYRLPWVILIGPSGSGKTTLLRKSSLKFPLSSEEEIHLTGFGGTRNCDWWFSDKAVILDTAGRYTTEASDKKEWKDFLSLLKRHRPYPPVNGIMITLSIPELMADNGKNIEQHAAIIRAKIEEIEHDLGYQLPIHLILTKTDLIEGFQSFFGHFTEAERQQLFGINLELAESQTLDIEIEKRLASLEAQLFDIVLSQLDKLSSFDEKIKAYQFPDYFHNTLKKVQALLSLILQKNPYQSSLNIRGLYFTSAEHKGFFITEVLSELIFSTTHHITMNQRTKWIFYGMKVLLATSILLGLFLLSIFWAIAYYNNKALINDSVNRVQRLSTLIESSNPDKADFLSAEYAVYQDYTLFNNPSAALPVFKRLGLFEGNILATDLQKVLSEGLQKNVLLPLINLNETALREKQRQWPSLSAAEKTKAYLGYYQLLKNYLLLGILNTTVDAEDVASISNMFSAYLTANHITPADSNEVTNLIAFYLLSPYATPLISGESTTWVPDTALINFSRAQLQHKVDVGLLYQELQASLNAKYGTISLSDLLPSDAADLFVDKVSLPAAYTKKAWQNGVPALIKQKAIDASAKDWVLNGLITLNTTTGQKAILNKELPNMDIANTLASSLEAQYFEDYLAAWLNWMNHLSMKNTDSLDAMNDNLALLARPKGPMISLFETIASNTDIHDDGNSFSLFSENHSAGQIAQAFANESDFINDHASLTQSSTLKTYLNHLAAIRGDLANIDATGNPAQSAQSYTASILQNGGSDKALYQAATWISGELNNEPDDNIKTAMMSVLTLPLRGAFSTLLTLSAAPITDAWQSTVLPAYASDIAGKFPFTKEGDDISLDAAASFFDLSQGTYWHFVNQNLLPYLKLEGNTWHNNTWLGVGMNFSPAFMSNLQQAEDISSALFSAGSESPKFFYAVSGVPSPDVSMLALSVNKQDRYAYENGPTEWHYFNWDSKSKMQQTHLMIVRSDGATNADIQTSGIWSLFELLDKANQVTLNGDHYVLQWQFIDSNGNPLNVSLGFKTGGLANIINGFVLHPFTPPETLLGSEK
jgi:type VI secretion system protein ImpL